MPRGISEENRMTILPARNETMERSKMIFPELMSDRVPAGTWTHPFLSIFIPDWITLTISEKLISVIGLFLSSRAGFYHINVGLIPFHRQVANFLLHVSSCSPSSRRSFPAQHSGSQKELRLTAHSVPAILITDGSRSRPDAANRVPAGSPELLKR